jgi:hypothetical protein
MDRRLRLLGNATHASQIIEMGAGYAPLAPKSEGWRTHVVDHATQEALRAKYANAGVEINAIEMVDTVWQEGPLEVSLPAALVGRVDIILASHVLEHIPDLIGFLRSASLLVVPGGCISVALPDRRYCFDCFRPWSTTGDLLEAHHQRRNRHGMGTLFNHMAYSATMNGQLGWDPGPIKPPTLLDPFQAAVATVALFESEPEGIYQDCHAWLFSPAGFRLVMLELHALGAIDWIVESLEGPEHFEFFATLRRHEGSQLGPDDLQARRQKLLVEQIREVREQATFMLGTDEDAVAGTQSQDLARLVGALDSQLAEMMETLSWVRATLVPVRRVWRAVRGKSR